MKCVKCGVDLPSNIGVITDGKVVCPQCASNFGTCIMCKHSMDCEFANNPDPMPKIIIETVYQGDHVVGHVPTNNPERVKKFCSDCLCYDKEKGCLKETGRCCSKYDEVEF